MLFLSAFRYSLGKNDKVCEWIVCKNLQFCSLDWGSPFKIWFHLQMPDYTTRHFMQIFKVSIIWEGEPNGRLLSRLQNQTRIYIVIFLQCCQLCSFFGKLGHYFVDFCVNNYLNNFQDYFCGLYLHCTQSSLEFLHLNYACTTFSNFVPSLLYYNQIFCNWEIDLIFRL